MSAMHVVEGVDRLEPGLGRLFVVIGVFDGLHLGHQYLLDALVREAGRLGARPTVLTFDHHPDEVITGTAPPLLIDPAERLARLEAAGVEVTIVQHFDQALRRTPYDEFVRRIASRADLAGFLMTPESAFGFERRGTPETLAALGQELGYEVAVVPPFTLDGQPVTSSAVRAAIAAGNLEEAARLLGRPYAVTGDGVQLDATRVWLRFTAPMALPPSGTWDATVELDPRPDLFAAHAGVEDGRLVLGVAPFEGRARVVFGPRRS
ncbi:MAG TPA: FAD synthetase family protein [Candidatus Binatia bacterium]|nr:FAD synthetase family protein [Candidatus Binatia bacterium]